MKVVQDGLVGKHIQCPTYATILEFENVDELQRKNWVPDGLITKVPSRYLAET